MRLAYGVHGAHMQTLRIVAVVVSTSLAVSAAAQPPPAAPRRVVAGVSAVVFEDFDVKVDTVDEGVYTPGGRTWQASGGVEAFVGRPLFTLEGVPIALELPVAYAPSIAQAPQDPLFQELGVEPDAVYRAVYLVPRLVGAVTLGSRWDLLTSAGVGAAWYANTGAGRGRTTFGVPVSAMLGLARHVGERWVVRGGVGAFVHARARDRSVYTVTAGLVRRF